VKSYPESYKASYSGFIMPDSGRLFVCKPIKFNYETTIASIRAFLSANPVPKGKKYALIMDNASWHRKAKRLIQTEKVPEYADIYESVTIISLPPYSPDLNPIEQVWRIARRENTHNVFFPDLAKLVHTMDQAFDVWSKPNKQLSSLCSFK
jgi:transposase